jgi:hypothetical protein
MISGGMRRPVLSTVSWMKSFDSDPSKAITHFWENRAAGVRRAKHMDGFSAIISDALDHSRAQVVIERNSKLRGYYRANKIWDLAIFDGERLLAAVEYKSQVGSARKNFNNRIEEALGNALDIRMASWTGKINSCKSPWLGYLFVLEDCEETRKKSNRSSVQLNYVESFDKMEQNLYNSTCLLLTSPGNSGMIKGEDSLRRFIIDLVSFIESECGVNAPP